MSGPTPCAQACPLQLAIVEIGHRLRQNFAHFVANAVERNTFPCGHGQPECRREQAALLLRLDVLRDFEIVHEPLV